MVKVWEYNDQNSGDNTLKLRNSWDGHYLGVVSVDVSTEGTSTYLEFYPLTLNAIFPFHYSDSS
jgi:hypothetical protein